MISPDDASTYGQVGAYAVLGAVTGYGAWKAKKAANQTTATGNGFAKKVTEALTRIEEAQKRTEEKIDHHIAAHADADVHREKL